ncbi:serine hydrolase-like protein [Hyposmocoma kahamanoa]|uniref:serine hydrolase-like protein n=1 Tax=Hyposmocoma kahamanoa TaxID=1477025 RepID=UPI000E6D6CF5|nr:serine hydrolase-like protein [Hyposmocoma kahamanoa]
MKPLKEWSVKAPWGNIALMSWGNPKGKPVLLIHGRQDSLSTFIPLLNKLPEKCHYVAFDLPGHGKSDPFPIGIKLMRLHFVSAMDFVVQHLGWKQFVVITHSMGGELAMFYNVVRPNKITKCIHLDIGMALRSITMDITPETYKVFYGDYYDNYHKENYDDR